MRYGRDEKKKTSPTQALLVPVYQRGRRGERVGIGEGSYVESKMKWAFFLHCCKQSFCGLSLCEEGAKAKALVKGKIIFTIRYALLCKCVCRWVDGKYNFCSWWNCSLLLLLLGGEILFACIPPTGTNIGRMFYVRVYSGNQIWLRRMEQALPPSNSALARSPSVCLCVCVAMHSRCLMSRAVSSDCYHYDVFKLHDLPCSFLSWFCKPPIQTTRHSCVGLSGSIVS